MPVSDDSHALVSAAHIHTLVRERALQLPGAEIYTFTAGWGAARVAGRWFALLTHRDGVPIINVKADPDDVTLLTATYAGITPGYHMNKKHWISLWPDCDVSASLLQALLEDSYLTVVAGLPCAKRPIDPCQFAITLGRGTGEATTALALGVGRH